MELSSNGKAVAIGVAQLASQSYAALSAPPGELGELIDFCVKGRVIFVPGFSVSSTNASLDKFASLLDYELFLNSFHIEDHFKFNSIENIVDIFTGFSRVFFRSVQATDPALNCYTLLLAEPDNPIIYFGLVRDGEKVDDWLAIHDSASPFVFARARK